MTKTNHPLNTRSTSLVSAADSPGESGTITGDESPPPERRKVTMPTPRHITDQLIALHADGSEDAMKEAAKIGRSLEPAKRQRSSASSAKKTGAKSKGK